MNEVLDKSKHQEEKDPLDDVIYDEDDIIDPASLVAERAFIGDYPFDVIIESLKEQFSDYINIEDTTDYVEIFYDQLRNSIAIAENDDEEDHPEEIKNALDRIEMQFYDSISKLFRERLTVTIIDLEDCKVDDPEMTEYVIRKLYSFFILNARENFKTIITRDIINKIGSEMMEDDAFFKTVSSMMGNYIPLITGINPQQFFEYAGENEINEFYDDGRVVGNFLRKYTPKLYINEELYVDIVNQVVLAQTVGKEIKYGQQ